ncbi:YybH family protein [Paraburkholderia antibiotica]|uniref:Nuclear transport factor 2 family protein n=1 Tax=Paraburkholderia antibiotica TaxID=2728839 RepID=A0A7X9X5D3_9BURK|nr:nuclear transport factor 2 family protein [Paraburkholderia antibiotica]NML31715.1 nuclear transport factor 2 family protein [Paraburkholderia antibiotica]
MNTLDNPVLQVLKDYQAAVFAKDVNAFVALYDREVRIFDMWGAWSYEDVASWRQMVEGWFGSLGTERVIVDFSDVQTSVAGELAVAHAFVNYKAVDTNGAALRSMDNRLSLALRQAGGGWKIVHQHTSSPIETGTAQVLFRR